MLDEVIVEDYGKKDEKISLGKDNDYYDQFIKICTRYGFSLKQIIFIAKTKHNHGIINGKNLRRELILLEVDYLKRFKKKIFYYNLIKRIIFHIRNPYMTASLR